MDLAPCGSAKQGCSPSPSSASLDRLYRPPTAATTASATGWNTVGSRYVNVVPESTMVPPDPAALPANARAGSRTAFPPTVTPLSAR
uniref:Uncharacterized protein n=1 Tax=Zea mays TaxID=4577 RepID=B6SHG8_MAIZE|nr:hypothetical protein [Zea mays]